MANHLETIWDTNPSQTNIVDAVVEDLVESFTLSLSTTELAPEQQAAVVESVRDAITNNYDFLDDRGSCAKTAFANKIWLCHFRHDWDKWQEGKLEGQVFYAGILYPANMRGKAFPYSELIQARTCKRCGFTQQKKIC